MPRAPGFRNDVFRLEVGGQLVAICALHCEPAAHLDFSTLAGPVGSEDCDRCFVPVFDDLGAAGT
jgi:hypothetical protein